MKTTTILASLMLMIAVSSASVAATNGNDGNFKKGTRTDTISVPQMQCGMCESRIEKAVKELKGVSSVGADADANRVIVTYNSKTISRTTIEQAIAAAGYDAGSATTTAAAQSKLSACCRPGGEE